MIPQRFEDAAGKCALLLLGLAPERRPIVMIAMANEFRATIKKQRPDIDFETRRAFIHDFVNAIIGRLRQLDCASRSEAGHA
jgi:hypothetical protein